MCAAPGLPGRGATSSLLLSNIFFQLLYGVVLWWSTLGDIAYSAAGMSPRLPLTLGAGRVVNSSTGVGPRCNAVPGFTPQDTYNTRAPIMVADLLSWLAENKTFVEIGTRKGDMFMCVAHYARHTTVVEADAAYCDHLRKRAAASNASITVQCPVMFGNACGDSHTPTGCSKSNRTYEIFDADVYYAWVSPRIDFEVLKVLHQGVKDGKIRNSAIFAAFGMPLAAVAPGARPVHLWQELGLSSRAARAYKFTWEDANLMHQHRHRHIGGNAYVTIFPLASAHIVEPDHLERTHCPHSIKYSAARCQPPSPKMAAALQAYQEDAAQPLRPYFSPRRAVANATQMLPLAEGE